MGYKPSNGWLEPSSYLPESCKVTWQTLTNQHSLAAAIEEVAVWLSANGVEVVADNAVMAVKTLGTNAKAITNAIMRIRQS